MYYKNDKHKELFLTLKKETGQKNDCEYISAIYVLSALIERPIKKHVQRQKLAISALLRESRLWNASEKALVRLAVTLLNADIMPVSIGSVFCHLDEKDTRVVLQALEMRYLISS